MNEKNLHILIYRYIAARIHYGYYLEGEVLPSIYGLSDMFGVSTMTIRCAYKLLEEQGYITLPKNKRAVVTYSARPDEPHQFPYLVPDEALQDLYQSFSFFLPGVFYCGLSLCDEADRDLLYHILDSPAHAWDEPAILFLSHIIGKLNNRLLRRIFYDAMLFSYPSYLARLSKNSGGWKASYETLYQNLRLLLSVQESGNWSGLWKMVVDFYFDYDPRSAAALPDTPARNFFQVKKLDTRNTAAVEVITRILYKIYPADGFLPSAAALAEDLSCSVITMRRTIHLLNKLGAAETVNGVGTRILSKEDGLKKICWTDAAIKDNILFYLQSLQVLVITCRRISESIFPHIDHEVLALTAEKIHAARREGYSHLAPAAGLDLLAQNSRLLAAKEIYEYLISLLILGHPLSYLEPAPPFDIHAAKLEEYLLAGNGTAFSAELENILCILFRSSCSKAVEVGIPEDEMPVLPS